MNLARQGRALLEGSLSQGKRSLITLEAPVVNPARLLALSPQHAVHLAMGDEGATGLGEGLELRASGPSRFEQIRIEAAKLFADLHLQGADAPPPRLFGGFAWQAGSAASAPWQDFGDARFVMPRWTYERHGDRAFLRFVNVEPAGALEEYERILAALERPLVPYGSRFVRVPGETFDAYRVRIEAITQAIAQGRFSKIVAARRVDAHLASALPLSAAVESLGRRYPGCVRYAFKQAGPYFVGATPEMLIEKRGDAIASEALAGTTATGRHAELMASAKDAEEHALVVDSIQQKLTAFAELAPAPDAPSLRELPGVLHLRTPVVGTLRTQAHVLDLVEALHPTPAVAGVPAADAKAWIAKAEPPRGWYASPVGSFDANGDGRFYVALRCGVVDGQNASAYAGGGIVAGSQADAEFAESELKLAAFLGALGDEHTPQLDRHELVEHSARS